MTAPVAGYSKARSAAFGANAERLRNTRKYLISDVVQECEPDLAAFFLISAHRFFAAARIFALA
jgi:hypothetical protein